MSVVHAPPAEHPAGPRISLAAPPRILGDCGDSAAGPTLIVVGGLHGNEPAGVRALERLFARLAEDGCVLDGRLLGLAGNRGALAEGRRFLADDLNRIWLPDRLERARTESHDLVAEDLEMAALDAVLQPAIRAARGVPFLLDLHTTSGPGPAFSVLHDTLANRRFARTFPVPVVLGLEEELPGTLMDYLTDHGAVALSVETGQHDDPASVDRAVAALWIAMDLARIVPRRYRDEVGRARRLLSKEIDGLPCAVEVRHRHAIPEGARFKVRPGFRSFQTVTRGEPIAHQDGRTVVVPVDGLLLMPLYQELGDDGFFVTRPVRELWLNLSTRLRRWRAERFLHWLPGIRRVPSEGITYLVDRRVARWLALEIFHLLGFRRLEHSATHLLMQRRVDRPRSIPPAA